MANQKYLFITHRAYTNHKVKPAGIDQIIDFFEKHQLYLIEHPLDSKNFFSSFLKLVQQKKQILLKQRAVWPKQAPWRWFSEIICGFIWSKELLKKEKISVIFAVDPLNMLAVLPLKLFKKTVKIYFFSADYSESRFSNRLFNMLYKYVYNLSLRLADKTFVVSARMHDFLSPLYPNKIIFLPNSPHFKNIPRLPVVEKNKFDLILCSRKLDEETNLEGIFKAVEYLKADFPEIKLHLVGGVGTIINGLIKKYKIAHNIIIHDFLSHEDVLKLVAKSNIGVCWYQNGVSQFFWGDSLKIREYAAAGLPVVCDGITSTAWEMEKYEAGFIIKTPMEMAEKIKNLIDDKELYCQKRENALKWAEKLDKGAILEKIFKDEGLQIQNY